MALQDQLLINFIGESVNDHQLKSKNCTMYTAAINAIIATKKTKKLQIDKRYQQNSFTVKICFNC